MGSTSTPGSGALLMGTSFSHSVSGTNNRPPGRLEREAAAHPEVEPGINAHLPERLNGGIRCRERPIVILVAVEIDDGPQERKIVFDGVVGGPDPFRLVARIAF